MEWLDRICRRCEHHIRLNPIPEKEWDQTYASHTLGMIQDRIPMFELTLSGLERGIRILLRQK